MSDRKSIPEHIKVKIWSDSAGRCQLDGCNKPLWYNGLTFADGNFAELAHIIGAKSDGPRGNNDSLKLQTDPTNIMLLCRECHKLVDDKLNKSKYSADVLISMKKKHEERVRFLLGIPRNQTTIITYSCKIKDRFITLDTESIYNAILPNYPDDHHDYWLSINNKVFNPLYDWKSATAEIDDLCNKIESKNINSTLYKLSIFGIGPMPLLFYLGYKLGDTISGEVYHDRRENIPEERFNWNEEGNPQKLNFSTSLVKKTSTKKVLITLAISDYIEKDKYEPIIDESFSVYNLSINKPNPSCITRKSDLVSFGYKFRELLNLVQKNHGKDCEIHLIPAVPASIAISAGRIILPTKDPEINLYEYLNGSPENVITINKK